MRKIIFFRKQVLTVLACALAAVAMFAAVNSPAIVGAAATTRQLPIYRVQRDQKMLSISFDAAWAEAILRQICGAVFHFCPPVSKKGTEPEH